MFDLNFVLVLIAEDQQPNNASAILTFLPFIMIGILFYVMIVRPQNKKQADLRSMLGNLKKNDRVITAGGIYGTIVNAPKDSDDVTLKIDESNNTRIRVQRSSISRVISAEAAAEEKES